MFFFWVTFLFQFEENTMRVGPQNEKSSWSGLTPQCEINKTALIRGINVLSKDFCFY